MIKISKKKIMEEKDQAEKMRAPGTERNYAHQ